MTITQENKISTMIDLSKAELRAIGFALNCIKIGDFNENNYFTFFEKRLTDEEQTELIITSNRIAKKFAALKGVKK